jgi:hypothetical protein
VARRADIQAEDRQVLVGSIGTETRCPPNVRLSPNSGRIADIPKPRVATGDDGVRVGLCENKLTPPSSGANKIRTIRRDYFTPESRLFF